MKFYAQGNTLSEYALLSALILLVAYSGVSLFGHNLSNLFQQNANNLEQNGINNYFNSTLGNHYPGSGRNSNTVMPNGAVLFTQSVSGGTNATSVEGTGKAYVLASLDKAKDLQALADKETDPNIKALLERMAQEAYWIGGSQATYEYHENGNTELSTLAQAMIDKKSRDPATATKALISIRDNENFLKQDLASFLSSSNIPQETKAFALQAANQVITESQAQYKAIYEAIPADEMPTSGLRTPDVVDPATGKKALDLVVGEGNTLLQTNDVNNTPGVKTSIQEGQNTTNYAQNF